jgi:excisionase family DNA binding protein
MARRIPSAQSATAPKLPRRARRYGSVATAAEQYGVSEKTIRRWIATGRLTGYRVGPRLLKIDLDELDDLARPIPTAGGAA